MKQHGKNKYFLWLVPRCVPIPKLSMEWPWSLRERIVSSLMSLDATMVRVANQGTLNRLLMLTKVSLATCDK